MATAMAAVVVLGVLSVLGAGDGSADSEASMPALLAHIEEIQRLSESARGEDAGFDHAEQPDNDFAASLGLPDASATEPVREADDSVGFFAHVYAVKRKMQEAAAEFGRLNSHARSEVLVEGDLEERHGEVDSLVLERFNQLETALKIFYDDPDGVEGTQLSADGGESDGAVNLLHHFVQERQQKRHREAQVEYDLRSEIATGEHAGLGRGRGSEDDEQEHSDGHDRERHLDGGMDALVLERFTQLEAALRTLNDEDDVEKAQFSADGGEGDDAMNLLHHFVQERQQKRHRKAQLESDLSHATATGQHAGIDRGRRGSKDDEHEPFDGHDHRRDRRHGDGSRGMDALVLERLDQLEAALNALNNRLNRLEPLLEILNNRDGVERMQVSADGGESGDASNLLHHFVQERQHQHGGLVV